MILSATTAGISFMGCSDVVVDSPNDVGTTAMVVKADIDASKTRGVSDDRFDDDDAIGVVLLDNDGSTITEGDMAKYSNCKYVSNGSKFYGADMANTIYYSDASIRFKALAYYPYSDSGLPFEIDTSVGGGMDQTKESQEKRLDILVSKCVETSLVSNEVEFTGDNAFSHVMAKLVIQFIIDTNSGFDDTLIAYDKETGDKVENPDQDKEYDFRSEVTDFISNLEFTMKGLNHKARITPSKVVSSQSVFEIINEIVDLKFPINEGSVNCSFPLNKSVIVTLLLIPQQTDVNITLVHPAQDGEEKFTTGEFNLDLKSGVTTILPIRVSKKGLQVNSAEIKDFEFWQSIDLGNGQFAPDIIDMGSLI